MKMENIMKKLIFVLCISYLIKDSSALVLGFCMYKFNNPVTWEEASDICTLIKYQLCEKVDICDSRNKVQKFIPKLKKDIWLPIGDEFNDWIYIGPKFSKQCTRMTDENGPMFWNSECRVPNKVKKSKELKQYCDKTTHVYCCKKAKNIKPKPISVDVYVRRRKENDVTFYQYSLDKNNVPGSNTDKANWKTGSTDGITKFSLMNKFVKNKFENPIYFCVRPTTTSSGIKTNLHMISKIWCQHPWQLNFYMYGSFSPVKGISQQRYYVEMGKNIKNTGSRISMKKENGYVESFHMYGPRAAAISDPCKGKTVIHTDKSGELFLPNKYNEKGGVICNWKIMLDQSSAAKFTFKKLNLPMKTRASNVFLKSGLMKKTPQISSRKTCLEDRVEIADHGIFCGTQIPPSFVVPNPKINIKFIGKSNKKGKRFSLEYEAIVLPKGMKMFKLNPVQSKFLSWNSAKKICSSRDRTLCMAKDVCNVDKKPFYGVVNADQWMPVNNEYNDWIQIGTGELKTCQRHNVIYGPPQWTSCRKEKKGNTCPKFNVLYCCDDTEIRKRKPEQYTKVLIYFTEQKGIVFSKYLRQGIDNPDDFGSKRIWSANRKKRGDFTSMILSSTYSTGNSQPVYFCSKKVTPAIGKLTTAYSVSLQPCETKEWKYLYHLYTTKERKKGLLLHYIGIYDKRPQHSRVHFRMFPESYKDDESFTLYGYPASKMSVA